MKLVAVEEHHEESESEYEGFAQIGDDHDEGTYEGTDPEDRDEINVIGGFHRATEPPSGKRAAAVASIIEQLIAQREDDPVPLEQLLDESGSDISQMGPCFLALELCGIVEKYTYDDGHSRKPRTAYKLSGEVEVNESTN